ncbi:MAG: hypothetical protein RBJ76_26135 [Stenomitos frigidus ULC029]
MFVKSQWVAAPQHLLFVVMARSRYSLVGAVRHPFLKKAAELRQ